MLDRHNLRKYYNKSVNFPIVDLELFNPSVPLKGELDGLKKTVFLSILTPPIENPYLVQLIELFFQAFPMNGEISLVLYIDDPYFPMEELETLPIMEQDFALDLVILKDLETPQLIELFHLSTYYIDLSDSAQFSMSLAQAMAMNLTLILLDTPFNHRIFAPSIVHYLTDNSSNIQILKTIYSHQQLKKGTRGYYISLISKLDDNWDNSWHNSNLEYIQENLENIKLVSIVFWGRSGSLFIHSLLDSHPSILTMGTRNFAGLLNFETIWALLLNQNPTTVKELLDCFINILHQDGYCDQIGGQFIFKKNKPHFLKLFYFYATQIFKKIGLLYNKPTDHFRRQFFIAIHFAYHLALGDDIRQKTLIAYQLHLSENIALIKLLLNDFPQMKVIGTIRHPVRGLYSLLHRGHDTPAELVFNGKYVNLYKHMLIGWKTSEVLLSEPVFPVVLEKLHQSPEKVMRKLSHWLKLPWHDNLLQSTRDGLPFSFESGVHGTVEQKIFDPKRATYEHWKKLIDPLDAFVLEGLLKPVMEAYKIKKVPKYQYILSHLLLFIPTKMEFNALREAMDTRNTQHIKLTLLSMSERYYYSYLFLCGYSFFSRSNHRQLSHELVSAPTNSNSILNTNL